MVWLEANGCGDYRYLQVVWFRIPDESSRGFMGHAVRAAF